MTDEDAIRLAEMLRETMRLQLRQQELQQQQFDFLRGVEPRQPSSSSSTPSHRGPTNPLHQTWRGFVLDLQHLEAIAKREGLKLTRSNVARWGVDSAKTITRTMEWYGLQPTDWPPSTWDPNEDRPGGAGKKIG